MSSRTAAVGRQETAMEGLRRGEQRSRGGRFRAEIEMDRGFAIPRCPELGFAAAVREPLVKLHRPKYDFERWDWAYFGWPHDRLDANLEMRDSDPKATFEADWKVSEGFLNRNMLQLEKYATDHYMLERQKEEEEEQEHELGALKCPSSSTTSPSDAVRCGGVDVQNLTQPWSMAKQCKVHGLASHHPSFGSMNSDMMHLASAS